MNLMLAPIILQEGLLLTKSEAIKQLKMTGFQKMLDAGALECEREDVYRISFVGVAACGSSTYWFPPKFLNSEAASDMKWVSIVVRALRRFSKEQIPLEICRFVKADMDRLEVSHLALSDWLLNDYFRYGLYRRKRSYYERDGRGPIKWPLTISKADLVLSNARPVYLNQITQAATDDGSQIVSRLHLYALEQIELNYAALLGYDRVSLNHEVTERLPYSPSKSIIFSVLQSELRRAYSERTIRLIKVLQAWFDESLSEGQPQLKLYGVSHFHTLWEIACGYILQNEFREWQNSIPKPIWRSSNGDESAEATFRPDIIRGVNTDNGSVLLLADAKYYHLKMPPQLQGNPGIQDVAKQLFYERVLRGPAQARNFSKILNCFLFPEAEEELLTRIGDVSLEGLDAGPIKIFYLSARSVLNRYTCFNPLSTAELKEVVAREVTH